MNPFSRFLRQWSSDKDFDAFIQHWDELEALVIRVYKQGVARPEEETTYSRVQKWLINHYPLYQQRLTHHWQEAVVAGQRATADPFLKILQIDAAGDFVGNWVVMQNLPAAREALNRTLLENS